MRLAVWPVLPARALVRALGSAAEAVVSGVVEVEPYEARAALDDGRADLALVPTLDVLRAYEGLEVVPGVALAGERSPRRRLVVGVPLDQIETVAFDPRDAQEAILAQLVLREHYGVLPTFALADPATPLADVLETASAALVDARDPVPDGAVVLDIGQEWTDLTLRPYPWGLLCARAGTLDEKAVARLQAAVRAAPPSDDLLVDGVAVYQLTLDGYAADGLDQLGELLFATGTLSEVPALPFVAAGGAEEPGGAEAE
ncbi:MqnA/MqnD/SBP family protein [Rubrivirga litoralis]|uniref:MqnA/MqnD/SBP family protein n=1 Tax=Rubrivirga litoralis TaxID=3075598 RepID=A0ABU3BN22_9BACT|nr:MqnA/MqnD/SBP family protein [Rubrivirga sp. F394]MDT0630620.1 MqnA/MqnD/SBP family protein [Rubrivirga sp. F394]